MQSLLWHLLACDPVVNADCIQENKEELKYSMTLSAN